MPGHQCYHCKDWVEEAAQHDCWTTTEAALTRDLPEDLQEAWERLREAAAEFGEQRIYASHKSIMFSRRSCYFFVRPKKSGLEVVFFLRRVLHAPQVKRTERPSRTKVAHVVRIRHRDEVEPPITSWLREAYESVEQPSSPESIRAPPTSKKKRSSKKAVAIRARAGTPAAPKRPAGTKSKRTKQEV